VIIVLLVCFFLFIVVVTLYATLGEEAIVHAVAETECSIVITSSELLLKFQVLLSISQY